MFPWLPEAIFQNDHLHQEFSCKYYVQPNNAGCLRYIHLYKFEKRHPSYAHEKAAIRNNEKKILPPQQVLNEYGAH